MPTKTELLRLQKLYRTDNRIAEAFGNGVTETLVAYWRRKKGVPKFNFPKFSAKEIQEVWDRFGDDFHAGMELGISKAAFYNWRRRYKITKKPEALKLEQLSLELFTQDKRDKARIGSGRHTIIQKIFAQHVNKKEMPVGETVEFEPDLLLACRQSGDIVDRFNKTDLTYVRNPGRIVISLDNEAMTSNGDSSADSHKTIRDFVRLQNIGNFFDIGFGSPCQVIIERGLVLPGYISLGSGPRIAALGAMAAAAFQISDSEMVSIWTTGKHNMTVPETIRVTVSGRLSRGLFARDIAHHIMSHISVGGGRVIELYGGAIEQLSISERLALCAMTRIPGVVALICPYDATTRRYLNPRARKPFTPILADRNAGYDAEYTFNAGTMQPVVSESGGGATITPLVDIEGLPIQMVFIGGMVNGRFEDLKIAADILKGKKLSAGVRLFVQPASQAVFLEATKKGLIRAFIENGAVVLNPGFPFGVSSNAFIGGDEKGLSTECGYTMLNTSGTVYFVSPATAAASALSGRVVNPAGFLKM